MAWFKRFYDPIVLPDGRELLTLRDAAKYITEVPKAENDAAEWRIAMETLLLVAERNAHDSADRFRGVMGGCLWPVGTHPTNHPKKYTSRMAFDPRQLWQLSAVIEELEGM